MPAREPGSEPLALRTLRRGEGHGEVALMDTINTGELVKSVSIENLLSQRNAVMERIGRARELLLEADEIGAAAGIVDPDRYRSFGRMVMGPDYHRACPLLDPEKSDEIRARIDSAAWSYLMEQSGLLTFMDSKAREDWRKQIDECKTPALTLDNITASFQTLYASRGDLFERGVLLCFKNLSWDYKTNRPFRFGKRIIIRGLRYSSFNHRVTNELEDLQRVFRILDGKPEEDHRNGLCSRLNDAIRGEGFTWRAGQLDDTYMHIRWFKNSNGHITFKRMDLVDRMNKILAKHYPGALPYDKHAEGR